MESLTSPLRDVNNQFFLLALNHLVLLLHESLNNLNLSVPLGVF